MNREEIMTKRRERIYFLFFIAASIYLILTFMAPLAPNRFGLDTAKTHLLQATIVLPVVAVWLTAVFGAERFRSYSNTIKKHRDGQAFNKIAVGVALLVISFIGNGTFGALRAWARRDGWIEGFTITANYLSAFLPLLAFGLMYIGSVELRRLIKKKTSDRLSNTILMLVLGAVAVLHISTLMNYEYRNSTPDPATYNSFYLSDNLILLTLALPHLIAWGMGMKAAVNIWKYQQQVKGVIYRFALFRLALGTLLVTGFSVTLQMLIAFSTYFSSASLASILVVLYVIILFYAAGFLVIASGAKRLTAIEKVK